MRKQCISSTYPGKSSLSSSSVSYNFGFPFCQRLWALAKRRDDIVVADMEVDMVADMVTHMVTEIVQPEAYLACASS